MRLTRPVTGWKRLLDPMTWAGIQSIGEFLLPTMEVIPASKLLGVKTLKGNPNGIQVLTYTGAAGVATWDSGTAGVTISTEFMPTADDPEQFKGFSVVPQGKVWFIPFASAEHNDGTSRFIFLRVYDATSSTYVDVASSSAAVTLNGRVYLPQPLLLREGMKIGLSVPSITAGNVGTIRCLLQELHDVEAPPWW